MRVSVMVSFRYVEMCRHDIIYEVPKVGTAFLSCTGLEVCHYI